MLPMDVGRGIPVYSPVPMAQQRGKHPQVCPTHLWGRVLVLELRTDSDTAHSNAVMGLFEVVAVLGPDRILALGVVCFRWRGISRNGVKYLGSLSVLLRNAS